MGGMYRSEGGAYHMGRNYALAHGWETIGQDVPTLLFGFGLGARGESRSLGTTGAGLQGERGDLATGTGLLVLLHEMGTLGLLFVAVSIAWIVVSCVRGIRSDQESDVLPLAAYH